MKEDLMKLGYDPDQYVIVPPKVVQACEAYPGHSSATFRIFNTKVRKKYEDGSKVARIAFLDEHQIDYGSENATTIEVEAQTVAPPVENKPEAPQETETVVYSEKVQKFLDAGYKVNEDGEIVFSDTLKYNVRTIDGMGDAIYNNMVRKWVGKPQPEETPETASEPVVENEKEALVPQISHKDRLKASGFYIAGKTWNYKEDPKITFDSKLIDTDEFEAAFEKVLAKIAGKDDKKEAPKKEAPKKETPKKEKPKKKAPAKKAEKPSDGIPESVKKNSKDKKGFKVPEPVVVSGDEKASERLAFISQLADVSSHYSKCYFTLTRIKKLLAEKEGSDETDGQILDQVYDLVKEID